MAEPQFDENGNRVYYYQTEEGQRLIKARAQSWQAARRRLIANHRDEYDALVIEERVKRGLSPEADNAQMDRLKARIAELERELKEKT